MGRQRFPTRPGHLGRSRWHGSRSRPWPGSPPPGASIGWRAFGAGLAGPDRAERAGGDGRAGVHRRHGRIVAAAGQLSWYPPDIERYVLAAAAAAGTAAAVCRPHGRARRRSRLRLLSARLAEDLMSLGFTLSRRWAPYGQVARNRLRHPARRPRSALQAAATWPGSAAVEPRGQAAALGAWGSAAGGPLRPGMVLAASASRMDSEQGRAHKQIRAAARKAAR